VSKPNIETPCIPNRRDARAPAILPNRRATGPAKFLCTFLTLAGAVFSAADAREPEATGFVMQNHAPFPALIGVPGRWPDTSDDTFDLTWNASSHSMTAGNDAFRIVADGETHSLTARVQFDLWRRLRIGLQMPWIQHSGGFMDDAIDAWHDLFSLPEGIRPQVDQDQLNYVLQRDGANLFRLNESVSGVGDLRLGIAVELGSFQRFARPETVAGYFLRAPWRVVLNVKLPTGDPDRVTGSGNRDFSVGLGWRSPDALAARLRWWIDFGAVLPGDVDIPGLETEAQALYYDSALTWRIVPRLDAILQVAGNSSLYASDASILGDSALQLAVGGLWHVSPRFGLRFGIFEDLLSETAPDFGVELSLLVRRP